MFPDATLEFSDGEYNVIRMRSQRDLEILSANGGGCSAGHSFWVCGVTPPLEYFWVIVKRAEVKSILFTKLYRYFKKPHELENDRPINRNDAHWRYTPQNTVSSKLYDAGVSYGKSYEIMEAQQELRYAERRYKREREHALAIAPLGKDHPRKYILDDLNREVVSCRQFVKDLEERRELLQEGNIFTYQDGRRRIKLVVIQITGAGSYYKDRSKYARLFHELATKGGELSHI